MLLSERNIKFGKSLILLSSCLVLFFYQCRHKSEGSNAAGDETLPKHNYKVSWNFNTEPDISHYLIYAWHGPDTAASPFIDSSSAGRYSQYFIKKTVHRPDTPTQKDTIEYVANGDWLQFAIAAVNNSGGVSSISVSDFIKSEVPDSLIGK